MTNDSNLGELISRHVAARLTPEFVEKEVTARIDKLIVESVDRALRSYSKTGKLIEDAVEDALKVNGLDLPSYGDTVVKILKVQIAERVNELVAGRLSQDMEELLSLAPKEVKLSSIAELMLENHPDGYGEVITVIVERNDFGSTWIYLDENQHLDHRDKYRCQHSLLVGKDGTISSATVDGRNLKDVHHVGKTYGLDQRIRAWVACNTKIILDEDYVVTSVGDY